MSNLEQHDVAITGNPEDRLQTFHVTILDLETGEISTVLTHNYSIEECALELKSDLIQRFKAIKIVQPDTKTTFNQSDISEL